MVNKEKISSIGEVSIKIVLGSRKARSCGKVLTTVVVSMDGDEVLDMYSFRFIRDMESNVFPFLFTLFFIM